MSSHEGMSSLRPSLTRTLTRTLTVAREAIEFLDVADQAFDNMISEALNAPDVKPAQTVSFFLLPMPLWGRLSQSQLLALW